MKEPASPAGDGSDAKKLDRMLKNRLSAKRSREIAKNHVVLLEKNVAVLVRQAQLLTARLASVEAENARLRHAQWMNPFVAVRDERSCAPATNEKRNQVSPEPAALLSLPWMRLLLFFLSAAERLLAHTSSPTSASNPRPETGLAMAQTVRWGSRSSRCPPCAVRFLKARPTRRKLTALVSKSSAKPHRDQSTH